MYQIKQKQKKTGCNLKILVFFLLRFLEIHSENIFLAVLNNKTKEGEKNLASRKKTKFGTLFNSLFRNIKEIFQKQKSSEKDHAQSTFS